MRSVDNSVDEIDESETLRQRRPKGSQSKQKSSANKENGGLNVLVVLVIAIVGLVIYMNRPLTKEQIEEKEKLLNSYANQEKLQKELANLKKEMGSKIEQLGSKINSKDQTISKLVQAIEIIGKDVISQDTGISQQISKAKMLSIETIYEQKINIEKLDQKLTKELENEKSERLKLQSKSRTETDEQQKAKIIESINKVLDERQKKVKQEIVRKEEQAKEKIRRVEAEVKIKEINKIREEDFEQMISNVTQSEEKLLRKLKQDQDKLNQRRDQLVKITNRMVPGQNLFRDRRNEEWIEPTLGLPTSDTEFNFTEVKQDEYLQFEKRIEVLMKPYKDTNCDLARYGNKDRQGGYLVCKNFISKDSALINIGIMDQDTFGCDFTEAYPMNNIQYDCTMTKGAANCDKNKNKNVQNQVCLADQTETFERLKYMSLRDMIGSKDLKKKHIIVKMNAEGAEWGALRTLPVRYLESIDQIFIEFHLNKFEKLYWGYADVIERLSRSFVSVSFNENNKECFNATKSGIEKKHLFTSPSFVTTLVNRNRIKLNSEARTYKKQAINVVSFPEVDQRCFMEP